MADKHLVGAPALPIAASGSFTLLDYVYGVIGGNSRAIKGVDLNAAIASIPIELTAARVASIADVRAFIRMQSASASTLTISNDATVPWPDLAAFAVYWEGVGQPTIVAGAGVTFQKPFTTKVARRYSYMTAMRIGADLWILGGDAADV